MKTSKPDTLARCVYANLSKQNTNQIVTKVKRQKTKRQKDKHAKRQKDPLLG